MGKALSIVKFEFIFRHRRPTYPLVHPMVLNIPEGLHLLNPSSGWENKAAFDPGGVAQTSTQQPK